MTTHAQSSVFKKIKTGSFTGNSFNISLDDRFLGATPQSAGLTISQIIYTYYCNLQIFNSAATLCGTGSWYADFIEDTDGLYYLGTGLRDINKQGVFTNVDPGISGRVPYFINTTSSNTTNNYIMYVDAFISEFI
jgi:hypothetical protein